MAITIRDVAREAGTTIGTVSKAMNNCHTISGETTLHIKAVAERLGYRPNARAQTFARKECREVVFLTHLSRDVAFTNPHMFEILVGAESILMQKGYSIKLYGCNADTVCSISREIMESKQADGLLFHASVVTRELSVELSHLKFPHIVMGKPSFNSSLCWIDNNNTLAGELAFAHLYELGHRDVAFISGSGEDRISQDRLDGVETRMQDYGMVIDTSRIIYGESTVENGAKMTKKLLQDNSTQPSAIICANNTLAFGCLRELQSSGIDVPTQMSLMTFDDYPLAQLTVPKLTTVSIDMYELGLSAGKLLVSKIKQPEMQVQTFTTIPRLVVRESTRAL